MHNRAIILFFCMIFADNVVQSQILHTSNPTKVTPVKDFMRIRPLHRMSNFYVLSGDFSARNLGFMCLGENKFEKISGLPLRLRLGSVKSTDRLEGKKVPLTGE